MSFTKMLRQTGTVQRATQLQDDIGDTASTFTTSSTIKCLVQPVSGQVRAVAGSVGVEVTHKMFCLYSADILESDRLVIGSTIYDVVFVADASGQGHHKEVDLREVRPSHAS